MKMTHQVSLRFTEPLKTISCVILFVIIFGKIFDEILGFAAFIPKESVLSPICNSSSSSAFAVTGTIC